MIFSVKRYLLTLLQLVFKSSKVTNPKSSIVTLLPVDYALIKCLLTLRVNRFFWISMVEVLAVFIINEGTQGLDQLNDNGPAPYGLRRVSLNPVSTIFVG